MSMKIQITQQDINKGVRRNVSKSKALGFLLALKLWGNSHQHPAGQWCGIFATTVWHSFDSRFVGVRFSLRLQFISETDAKLD